jgi:hypothetical protein
MFWMRLVIKSSCQVLRRINPGKVATLFDRQHSTSTNGG